MQNHMIVVAHHRIGGDINSIDAGQHQQTVFDPLPAVFEITAAVTVFTAQKGAAYAAGGAVIVEGGIEGYQCAPWSGHSALLSNRFA
jgi:hypothetical protein